MVFKKFFFSFTATQDVKDKASMNDNIIFSKAKQAEMFANYTSDLHAFTVYLQLQLLIS